MADFREGVITISGSNFTLKPVALSDMSPNRVFTFLYGAQSSGTTGRSGVPENSFDRTPLITPINIGKQYLDGLNVHYLSAISEKTRYIMKFRMGSGKLEAASIRQMFHRYRLDRVDSRIYMVKDLFVDASVLLSVADWKRINS